MTITLQAANELIASLESAGELSIREQKFLKLAKAYQQLAAENVARKNGNGTAIEFRDFYAWWNILNEDGLRTEEERMLAAGAWMARSGLGNTDEYQYVAPETPTTDRIVAGIKADGVEQAANECYGAGYICETLLAYAKQMREGADKC
ncbi:TPA: hypothetical protein ACHBVR_002671 [Klebsiella pneumoniae]|nr:hypothetical protein [Klebsiella pneumoniae subsp. pneumoniae]HEP0945091.1 hypothetical protein [Klebsiella pneumoniae subsp. pneumoniae]